MQERNEIVLMTFDQWEEEHKIMRRQAHKQRTRERRYYAKQKVYGLLVVLFGLLIVAGGEWLQWFNLKFMGDVVILFGMFTAITQKRLIVD